MLTGVINSFSEKVPGSRRQTRHQQKHQKEEKTTNAISDICTEEHEYGIETTGYRPDGT